MVLVVSSGFDHHIFSFQGVGGPIEAWVESLEPQVSQDYSVSAQVGHIET